MGQFMEFAKAMGIERRYSGDRYNLTDESVMTSISLQEAMLYCWWFSDEEGIPEREQCYVTGRGGEGGNPETVDGFLSKTGYRLPTEAEWEYACRAGTETSRYYGRAEELLPRYGWFLANQESFSRVPGLLRPNGYGLFDMLGNGAEWCQERYQTEYRSDPFGERIIGDAPELRELPPRGNWAVCRGGSFLHPNYQLRSAYRDPVQYRRLPGVSFRIVRTFASLNNIPIPRRTMNQPNNINSRDVGDGKGQHGSSGDCPTQGHVVFRWNGSRFVMEENNCNAGYVPSAPPVPSSSQIGSIEVFDEFRAIICCESGPGSSSSSSS